MPSIAPGYATEVQPEHPLKPLVSFAEASLQRLQDQVTDYSCTLVKRERVDGKLRGHQFIQMKIRHEHNNDDKVVVPFSVYLKFLTPRSLEGREVIYIEGQNRGRLIARNGGQKFPFLTTALAPESVLAMKGNRYPITKIGIKHMMNELLTIGREDLNYGECEVKYFSDTEINKRPCTAVQVIHPVRRDHFRYHVAEIFVDNELQFPVRYAAYDWPDEPGGPPRLIEEYTYLDLKFNVGLTDHDFDHTNPEYRFRKDFKP